MPSNRDLTQAAQSLRLVVEKTEETSLADARLAERLELAADVLEAAAKNR
jgi:hypothetical protein